MSSSSSSIFGTADIAGVAVGGVFILITIIGIILSCYALFCRKNNPPQVGAYPPPPDYQNNSYGRPMNTGYYSQQPYQPPQKQYWGPQPTNNAQQPYQPPQEEYWDSQPTNNAQQPYQLPQEPHWYPQPINNAQQQPYYTPNSNY